MLKTRNILGILTLSVSLLCMLAVNSCEKIDSTVDDVVDSYLAELYSSSSGLTIKIDGDEATITDFGTSYLGNNKSVIDIGDVYIRNIKRTGPAKWSAEIIEGDYYLSQLNSVSYVSTDLTVDGKSLSISNPDKWDIMWSETTNPGGGGGGNKCYEGTWYSNACGDSKGVIWTFNSDMTGSFSNKDCNGICTPMVFTFTYEVSGSTITTIYDDIQPIVKCTGYNDSRPPKPKNNGVFTFECNGSELTVNSGNGPNTFTR